MRRHLDKIRPIRARLAGAFARDRRGATAVAFALSFAVLAPLSLGVFDVYMGSEQRGKLQDALDAATLFAARSSAQTDTAIDAVGDTALAANLKLISGATLQSSNFHLSGTKVVASASVTLPAFAPTLFAHQPVQVNAEVQRAMDRLEVTLVLDNTGSMTMNGSPKLSTLKTQAKILVDKLSAAAARSSDPTPLRISLVPFSNTVRVQGNTSVSSYNNASHTGTGIPSWIEPQGKSHWGTGRSDIFSTQYTDRFTVLKSMSGGNLPWAGCVEARPQPYDVQETAPTSTDNDTMFVPFFWPDEPNSNGYNSSFNTYIADGSPSPINWLSLEKNPAKYNGKTPTNGTFTALGMTYTKGPNAGCTLQPIIRLTTDFTAIKTGIDNMNAIGETNIPMGLVWGWHTLTPNAPFADGSAYNTPHLKKVVILMTDGENTDYDSSDANASYYGGFGFIWQGLLSGLGVNSTSTQRTAAIDARLGILCSNMKAQKIQIYTIRVEVTSGTSTLLQNCASSPDMFFDVTNVANLGLAFDAIAGAITNLRISH